MAVGIKIKSNSVKFQLKLPVGTELGNFSSNLSLSIICIIFILYNIRLYDLYIIEKRKEEKHSL